MTTSVDVLVDKVIQGDVRSLARLLRSIDDRAGSYRPALSALFSHTGKARILGITGNPGAGKSTLTDHLIGFYRRAGQKVGVIAVDPTSPFSGGAILGDRIRMQRHALDEGVFIRSLATRGHLGGISRSTADSVHALDAWGADIILVETVGVGQDELDIAKLAQTTIVVMAPGMGDEIQAIKAGILEVADVFVVNKADRDGADSTVRDLEGMIGMTHELYHSGVRSGPHHGSQQIDMKALAEAAGEEWLTPIVRTVASKGEGIKELAAAVEKHRLFLFGSARGEARRRERLQAELYGLLRSTLTESAVEVLHVPLQIAVEKIFARESDPYSLIDELVHQFRSSLSPAS